MAQARRGHTVLQVPVPELEPFVVARTRHYDPDFLSADPRFVHAHITVLGPFVAPDDLTPHVLDRVAEIVAASPAFDFDLSRLATFPDGIIHLVPDPSEPFTELTANLAAAFPDHPPYGGRFGTVAPHLTLDATSPDVSIESTIALLGDLIPAQSRANQVDLALWANRDCRTLTTFPLADPRQV